MRATSCGRRWRSSARSWRSRSARQGRVDELKEAIGRSVQEVDRLSQLAEDLLLIARSEDGGLALQHRASRRRPAFRRRRPARRAARAGGGEARDGRARRDGRAGRPHPARAGARQPGRQCAPLRRRLDHARRARATELHVTDDGPGFPPGFLDRAFERFSRADAARGAAAPGSGSRSSGRSPRPTEAARTRPTARRAPTSGCRSPASRARSSRGSGPRTSRGRRSRPSRR